MRAPVTISLAGTLDRAVEEVDRQVALGTGDVTLDFKPVTFVSVEALEWLEELLLRSRSLGVSVSFVDVPPEIYKVFKVAHIDSLLEACGALPRSGPAC
jgi:anti-anti-sigma regulatory factor